MKFNNKITAEKYDCLITSKGEFICLDSIDDEYTYCLIYCNNSDVRQFQVKRGRTVFIRNATKEELKSVLKKSNKNIQVGLLDILRKNLNENNYE